VSFSLVGDVSPATGVDADLGAVLTAARAGADWAWTRLYRAHAAPVLAYLQAHDAPDPQTSLGAVFRQLAQELDEFDGDEPALRRRVLWLARYELDGWAKVFGSRERRGPIFTRLDGLPAVAPELEERHVAAAVNLRRARADEIRIDGPAPPRPRPRLRSAPPRAR
jgi:hypothetical protein